VVNFFVCPGDASPCDANSPTAVSLGMIDVRGSGDTVTATSPTFDAKTLGSYCFWAAYSGAHNYASVLRSSTSVQCFTVTPAGSVVTAIPGSASVLLGASNTDTATVAGASGLAVPTGTVTFYVCGPETTATSCVGPTPASGSGTEVGSPVTLVPGSNMATATSAAFTPTATGIYCFLGVYSGDDSYSPSSDGSTDDECFTVASITASSAGLGNPENSLGTGNLALGTGTLSCGGITCANHWLAISGYCTAREDGDEISSYYDGNGSGGGTLCPGDASWPPPTTFTNTDYNPNGYVYDIDVPPAPNSTTTAGPVTVEIYDPSYNPPITASNCSMTTPGSAAGDNSDMPCGVTASVTTNWLIYGPGTGVFDPSVDPVLAPIGGSRSSPGVFGSGDTTCENAWCSLYVIPAGSQAGSYHLNLWTLAGEHDSAGANAFALRALVGIGPTPCGFTCTSASVVNPANDTFQPCSTIAEGPFAANPQCPEIHGDTHMVIYVDSGAMATPCNPGPRQEQSGTVTGNEPCTNFYLAQVAPNDAGQTMTITLFDPDAGATAIQILQPDGTPASFTYQTVDTNAEDGCPSAVAPNSCAPYISDDGNDPPDPNNPVTCICDLGLRDPPLSGRVGGGRYNDRYLEIQVPVTSDMATLMANGGWYTVQYVFANSSVSDLTTWSVSLSGAVQTSSSIRPAKTRRGRGVRTHSRRCALAGQDNQLCVGSGTKDRGPRRRERRLELAPHWQL
jgi:hypothetical protein